jgi:hypothetical protein
LERIDFELRSLLSARLVAERDGLVARSTQSRAAHHRTSCALARRASIWEASAVPPYRRFCPIERQKWSVERWKWAVERENTHVESQNRGVERLKWGVERQNTPVERSEWAVER